MSENLALILNEKMRDALEFGWGDKVLPYLGWFWRDLSDWQEKALPLSKPEDFDFYWLDCAHKWSYPSITLDEEKSEEILRKMITHTDSFIELMRALHSINIHDLTENSQKIAIKYGFTFSQLDG